MKKKKTVKFLGALALATALLTGPMISDTMQFGKGDVQTAQAAKVINGSKLVVPAAATKEFKSTVKEYPDLLRVTFIEATPEMQKYRYVVNKDTYGYANIYKKSEYKQKFSLKGQRKMQLVSFSMDEKHVVYAHMRFVDGYVGPTSDEYVSLLIKASDLKIQM